MVLRLGARGIGVEDEAAGSCDAYLLRHITNCEEGENGDAGFFVLLAFPSFLAAAGAGSVAAGVAGAGGDGDAAEASPGDWSPALRFLFFPMARYVYGVGYGGGRGADPSSRPLGVGSRSLDAVGDVRGRDVGCQVKRDR